MIKGPIRNELTMESILEKISSFDIYKKFMTHGNWDLNSVCISPFTRDGGRTERNASFLIGNKYGEITYIDYGNSIYRGDCFNFVKQIRNLSNLDEVLRTIDSEFGLGLTNAPVKEYKAITGSYEQPIVTKRNTIIQVTTRKFTNEELQYWNSYYQDIQDLLNNNIYSIKTLYLNRKKFPLKDTELRFGYYYDGHWKIYRPFNNKKEKWFPNNTPITVLDGKEKIKNCKVAFINKSKKDHMVISKIFPCSIGVQNEGIACFSEENVRYLKENSEKQYLSFDADAPGVKNSQQITQLFGFDYCNVPRKYLDKGIKDWADLAKNYDLETIKQVLKEKGIL